jgi:hypothetical protein
MYSGSPQFFFYFQLDTLKLLVKENLNGAKHKLGDFIDYAKAQRGKKIPEEQAGMLIGYAQWIIDNIN